MDLIMLLIPYVVVGFVVWLLITIVPMPPKWASTIQVVALLLVILHILTRLPIPNVLR